jgi:hypothetical protein
MFEIAAPPVPRLGIKPNTREVVRVSWHPYAPVDAAGHHILGYRVYRSLVANQVGSLVADETTLGPTATFYDDTNQNPEGTILYYTLFAVEVTDFGARPFGEGGNVPFGV